MLRCLKMADFKDLSTSENDKIRKMCWVSTFEKVTGGKMSSVSTVENRNCKILFFVSTRLDCYKCIYKNRDFRYNHTYKNRDFREMYMKRKIYNELLQWKKSLKANLQYSWKALTE